MNWNLYISRRFLLNIYVVFAKNLPTACFPVASVLLDDNWAVRNDARNRPNEIHSRRCLYRIRPSIAITRRYLSLSVLSNNKHSQGKIVPFQQSDTDVAWIQLKPRFVFESANPASTFHTHTHANIACHYGFCLQITWWLCPLIHACVCVCACVCAHKSNYPDSSNERFPGMLNNTRAVWHSSRIPSFIPLLY